MKPEVREPAPSARFAIAFGSGWIGGHARDPVFIENLFGAALEPARMPRFDRDIAVTALSQRFDEGSGDTRVENEARGQLDEQASEPVAQGGKVLEKGIEELSAAGQAMVMRDRPR